MKIAMIGQKGIPAIYGGVERHVEELSVELGKLGHEILVYGRKWYSRAPVIYPGVKVIRTLAIHTKHLDAISHTFFSTIHAMFQKVDVIHYHGVGPALLSWIPRVFSPKTKVIATFHCLDRYHQKWGFIARLFLKFGEKAACLFPHQTIAVSKTIKYYCLNEYLRNAAAIPNGVTMPGVANAVLLDRWNLKPNGYVLMVSRLVRHKGAQYLIEAWKLLKKQNINGISNLKLVIVGDATFTDAYVADLKTLANGNSDIIFTGWQSGEALNALYANSKLLVHPSENEGLPITVLQAMSAGRAVLVSDIPEHQEVITDNRFWFLNANVLSLAGKLAELIGSDAMLNEAGAKNADLVKQNYSWKDIAKKTEQLYFSPFINQVSAAEMEIA